MNGDGMSRPPGPLRKLPGTSRQEQGDEHVQRERAETEGHRSELAGVQPLFVLAASGQSAVRIGTGSRVLPGSQPWFEHTVDEKSPDQRQDQPGHGREEIVHRDAGGHAGALRHDRNHFLRDALEQGVERANEDPAGVAAVDAGVGTEQPGGWMPARGLEDQGRQRRNHDDGRVRHHMALACDEGHHIGKQAARRPGERDSHGARQETAPLRDADCDQHHQHGAEWWEADEVLDEVFEPPDDAIGREDAADRDRAGLTRDAYGHSPRRCECRHQRQHDRQVDEQHERVGNPVANPFDEVEEPIQPGRASGNWRSQGVQGAGRA